MSVSGFWGPETKQVTGPPLTVWTRPLELASKTKPSESESDFLLRRSAGLGSRLVGQPSQTFVPLPSTRHRFSGKDSELLRLKGNGV